MRNQISLDARSWTKCERSGVTEHPWLNSLQRVENRVWRFVSGKFHNDFPFATERMMSRQFSTHPITIKEILRRDLGLGKFARRWVTHQLNPSQNVQRIEAAKLLLQIR
jgi:hypothetical protein